MCKSDAAEIAALLETIKLAEGATYRSQMLARLSKTRALFNTLVQRTAKDIEGETLAPVINARAASFISAMKSQIYRDALFIADLAWKAAGGKGSVSSDYARNFANGQELFLKGWEDEIKRQRAVVGGTMRANMYVDRLMAFYQEVYYATVSVAKDVPQLPAYPRDGTTICLTNCKCKWRLEYGKNKLGAIVEVKAFWVLSPVENCPTCLCRSSRWNPLTFIRQPNAVWEQRESGASQCELYRS